MSKQLSTRSSATARRFGLLAVAALGVLALMSSDASSAEACSGGRIEHIPIRDGGRTDTLPSRGELLGHLDVYYNGSTGRNCARTTSAGTRFHGKEKSMEVYLERCRETSPRSTCTLDDYAIDSDFYFYYAGDVDLWARGRCIYAKGMIISGSYVGATSTWATTGRRASHCGS